MSTCKSCGQEIEWVTVSTGYVPVDLEEIFYDDVPEGMRLISFAGLTYRVTHDINFPNIKGQICHWDSCEASKTKVNRIE